jgi:hypothetical protein
MKLHFGLHHYLSQHKERVKVSNMPGLGALLTEIGKDRVHTKREDDLFMPPSRFSKEEKISI